MSPAAILPLALVMIAGPQIVGAFFLATSEHWAKNSLAYIGGAAISISIVVTIAYFAAKGAKSEAGSGEASTAHQVLDGIVLLLLLILVVRVYLTRKESEPPKWMSKLQAAEPKFAFGLGFVLLGVFPTDILTSITVGLHLARHGEPWWHYLPFLALTLLILALPAIAVALLGERADVVLPKVRDWMNDNAWVVSEVVLVFFIVITVNSLASG